MFSKFQFSPCQNSCLHKQLQSCILTLHVYVHWAIKNGCREINPKLDWSLVWNSSLISWETTMTLFSRYSYQEDLSGIIWHQFNPYTKSLYNCHISQNTNTSPQIGSFPKYIPKHLFPSSSSFFKQPKRKKQKNCKMLCHVYTRLDEIVVCNDMLELLFYLKIIWTYDNLCPSITYDEPQRCFKLLTNVQFKLPMILCPLNVLNYLNYKYINISKIKENV